jgi:hypothetical protein
MERDYLIETVTKLLTECQDIELLYLIKSLLTVEC